MEKPRKLPFDIRKITKDETGSVRFVIEVTDEFKEWFKKEVGLKRWSQKRFHKWFGSAFPEYVRRYTKSLNTQKEESNVEHTQET